MITFKDIAGRYQSFKCRFCGIATFFNNYLQGTDEKTKERYPIPCYQCQVCGTIQTSKSKEIEHIWEYSNDRCECGGELRRDMALFCPSCKTQRHVHE